MVTDEVYEHLVFDGAARAAGHAAGDARAHGGHLLRRQDVQRHRLEDRLGLRAAPAARRGAHRVKQFLTYVNGAPFQRPIAEALAMPVTTSPVAATLQAQRDLLCGGLAELGFDVIVPQATYFATVELPGTRVDFCRRFPVEHRVVAIPSSVFYDSHDGDITCGSRSASDPKCSPKR